MKNAKLVKTLLLVLEEANVLAEGCDKAQGALLYSVATKFPANALLHRLVLVDMIMEGKAKSNAQVEGGFKYLSTVGGEELQVEKLEEAAGVGVEISPEEIGDAKAAWDHARKTYEEILRQTK